MKISGLLKYLRRISFFLFGVFLLYIAFRGKDFAAIYHQLKQCNWIWIIWAKVFGITIFYIRSLRWKMLINSRGYQVDTKYIFLSTVAGLFANLIIPRSGELYRCWVIKKKHGISINYLIGTVIVERSIDVLAFLFFTLLVILLFWGKIAQALIQMIFYPLAEKIEQGLHNVFFVLIMLFGLVIVGGGLYMFRKKRSRLYRLFKRKVLQFLVGLRTIRKVNSPALFVAYSLAIYFIGALSLYISSYSLEGLSGFSVKEALLTYTMSGYGMAVPVQGGLGAYEVMVSKSCEILGYAPETGLTFAIVMHLSAIAWQLLFGGIGFFILYLTLGEFKKEKNYA